MMRCMGATTAIGRGFTTCVNVKDLDVVTSSC